VNQKTAQLIFLVFNLLAILAVGYAIYDFIEVNRFITTGRVKIAFDSGTYYLLLMSIFWVLGTIQMLGKRNNQTPPKYSSLWVVGWFILMLVLANVMSYYIENRFEHNGYVKHDDPDEISRIAKGESSIYVKQ
jgi:hypothetical protein